MPTESYQTQLERVQSAIAELESGERVVRRGDREFSAVDLPALYAREKELRGLAERAARGGMRMRQGVPLD